MRTFTPKEPLAEGKGRLRIKYSQDVADIHSSMLRRYWGRDLVFENLTLGAYDPAKFYDMDESKRADVEKGMSVSPVQEGGWGADIRVTFEAVPVLLQHRILVKKNGQWLKLWGHGQNRGGSGLPFTGTYSVHLNAQDLRAGEKLELHVVPVPGFDFDAGGPRPWGGEIVIRDVPVKKL